MTWITVGMIFIATLVGYAGGYRHGFKDGEFRFLDGNM